jgi:hypothetical protein
LEEEEVAEAEGSDFSLSFLTADLTSAIVHCEQNVATLSRKCAKIFI